MGHWNGWDRRKQILFGDFHWNLFVVCLVVKRVLVFILGSYNCNSFLCEVLALLCLDVRLEWSAPLLYHAFIYNNDFNGRKMIKQIVC